MVATKSTFETTFRTVYWKEGKDKDPVPAGERITPLVAAFPKVLQDEVDATEDIPSGTGRTLPRSLNVAWGAVVSVNPDVMIVTIRKQAPRGAPVEAYPFEAWVSWPANDARGEELQRRMEDFAFIVQNSYVHISAGPLAPWSEEMWAVSTEPAFQSRRIAFENDHAIVTLPGETLVLTRRGDRDDRVDVVRK
jgi:hypothetical protein